MVHEKTTCPRCQRRIDAFARLCPFCNFENRLHRDGERTATIPLPSSEPQPGTRSQTDSPLRDRLLRHPVVLGLGIALMLISAFAVGALVNLLGSRGKVARAEEEKPPAALEAASRERGPLSDLTLVPVSEATSNTGAVTSAPLPSVDATLPVEAQRSDATALPSSEYSKVLAQAARISEPEYTTVDPRSLPPGLGALRQPVRPAPSQEREREPAEAVAEPASDSGDKPEERGAAPEARRTNPVPLKQPLPRLDDLRDSGTVRLRLTVSDDGRVKEIDVLQGLSGATADVVDAVRRWRFKPATLNGQPVQGTFEAEIMLNGQR